MGRLGTKRTAAALLAAALALTACSNITRGHPDSASMTSAKLGAILTAGAKTVTTAHMDMSVDAAGVSVTAKGDEQQTNGQTSAVDISEQITNVGSLEMIVVTDQLYLKLPDALNPTDKPWVRITSNTSDPTLAPFVKALDALKYSASMDRSAIFAEATDHIVSKGKAQVDGVATDHYALTVLVDKLPSDFPDITTVKAAGIDAIPIELWVDSHGRTVKLAEKLAVGGQQSSTNVTMSAFNKPVTITAPPADQVATR
jgi:hypothetical protein